MNIRDTLKRAGPKIRAALDQAAKDEPEQFARLMRNATRMACDGCRWFREVAPLPAMVIGALLSGADPDVVLAATGLQGQDQAPPKKKKRRRK